MFYINLLVRLNLGCILKVNCLVALDTLDFGGVVVSCHIDPIGKQSSTQLVAHYRGLTKRPKDGNNKGQLRIATPPRYLAAWTMARQFIFKTKL